MKRLLAFLAIVLLLCVVLLPALGYSWYSQVVPSSPQAEEKHKVIDKYFKTAYDNRNPIAVTINNIVFHNNDKYVWRPPRILSNYGNDKSGATFFALYGMVTFWEPDTGFVGINTYTGKKLIVRFDPEGDKSFAFMPNLDKYGALKSDVKVIPIVSSRTTSQWPRLFCAGDIITVVAAQSKTLLSGSRESPLVPHHIELSQRVCKS